MLSFQLFMHTLTSHGITISVVVQYLPMHSSPREQKYIFGYHIVIENGTPHTVQLLRRRWAIKDADGSLREVEGEGVVGLKPVLEPGQQHSYSSFCNLRTELGTMAGAYQMCRVADGHLFEARVPEFDMIFPGKLN
ncbi:MAG: Co2+/Mg2+ efflux protein ApaG [Saprospiraceae bacterium]|nr:Co2+/Mg2+ efflux protein ApaG [Saprospiraceae bacterium]